MASLEREPGQLTPEEIAEQQVEGYLEQVEHWPEISGDVAGMTQAQPVMQPEIIDDQGQVVATAIPENAIDLPLTQTQVEEGLHHPIVDAIRWLSEFCVMIIKKYPGRVFYKQNS